MSTTTTPSEAIEVDALSAARKAARKAVRVTTTPSLNRIVTRRFAIASATSTLSAWVIAVIGANVPMGGTATELLLGAVVSLAFSASAFAAAAYVLWDIRKEGDGC